MKPSLQNRWKIEGKKLNYYGLRHEPYTFKRSYKLSKNEQFLVSRMTGKLDISEYPLTNKIKLLMDEGVIVDQVDKRVTPKSLDNATYCKRCVANDYMIPGIEFDEEGICPLCRLEEGTTKELISVMPIMNTFKKASKSRFDVAVFYTGGKDSSFLLHYLANELNLRVLALTWEIPFLSPNAKESIEHAKKKLPNVEFVNRRVMDADLDRIYQKLMALQDNTCMCPYLAYYLFYPLLVDEKIPYLVAGNEPVQMKNVIFNQIIPLKAYQLTQSQKLHRFINTLRILTFKKPYKPGQFQMVTLLKQLVYGDSIIKRLFGYKNEFMTNIHKSILEVPSLIPPLRKALKRANRSGNIPTLVHVDFNEISPEGIYKWNDVKEKIKQDLDWVEGKNSLHTSCIVEDGKDCSQFRRFYLMKSQVIPFSALELSLAVSAGNVSRDDALKEIKSTNSFTLETGKGYQLMQAYYGKSCNTSCNRK